MKRAKRRRYRIRDRLLLPNLEWQRFKKLYHQTSPTDPPSEATLQAMMRRGKSVCPLLFSTPIPASSVLMVFDELDDLDTYEREEE